MTDLFDLRAERPGTRLHRLELFNWGTFDSNNGEVYVANPQGRTTLLVGRNGSGKSTLVDAILTLLVPNAIRNYNVAAGANKTERTERTYVLGACDQQLGADDAHVTKRYLRSGTSYYSALLAYFHDENIDSGFTLAQVLYPKVDGSVDKVFAFAEGNKSIAADLQGLTKSDGLLATLRTRGFRATKTFSEYHGWFVRRTAVKPLAMDMFNQTVAVKDIRTLNAFIRSHMLESSGGRERVQKLIQHFSELRAAHRQLVRIRTQYQMLLPIEKFGKQYNQYHEQLRAAERLRDAADPFFRAATVRLATPELERFQQTRAEQEAKRDQLRAQIAAAQDEARQLKNEIDLAGGDRLRQIPTLIELQQTHLSQTEGRRSEFLAALKQCGRTETVETPEQFAAVCQSLRQRRIKIAKLTDQRQSQRDELVIERRTLENQHAEIAAELEILQRRRTNLPGSLARLRTMICADLTLPEDQLPFAAELIAVQGDQREWESSIEMVLRSFALSLLVPNRLYRRVSTYIEQTRLVVEDRPSRDAGRQRSRGQRLVYLRVASDSTRDLSRDRLHEMSLVRKLQFRDGHPLVPWVTLQVESRFDYRCCETMEAFREAPRLAVTKNRHTKAGNARHEKDDRDKMTDPSGYVLGWDNRAKRQRLAVAIAERQQQITALSERVATLDHHQATLTSEISSIERCLQVTSFEEIDDSVHRSAIRALLAEKEALESNNDQVRVLRARLSEVEQQAETLQDQRDEVVQWIGTISKQIQDGERLINAANSKLAQMRADGRLATAEQVFAEVEAALGEPPLAFDNLFEREQDFLERQRTTVQRLQRVLEPIESKLTKAMGDFFKKCQEERDDLDASIEALPSFLAKLENIRREDLPRHESRFKQRLNETVTKEIGVFHSELQNEGRHIQRKIEELNEALRELPYNDGTFMRLDVRPVKNAEVLDFRNSLRSCLDDSFDDSEASNEARFQRIEALISRLSEESTWRDRVIDVRRWYDFGACEIDAESGETRSYYEDSSGQSGGEKARLAFTILVAAIAYQYDLDLSGRDSRGFHFVVVDEMFSKIDDRFAQYALKLFERFGLQLMIVAPLDAKARVTESFVQYYLQVLKDEKTYRSQVVNMTAREYEEVLAQAAQLGNTAQEANTVLKPRKPLQTTSSQ